MFNTPIAVMKGAKVALADLIKSSGSPIFDPFVTKGTSKSNKELFPVFLTRQGMRKFTDKISFQDQVMKYLEVINDTWYNGFDIDFDTLSDSQEYMGQLIKSYCTGLAEDYNLEKDKNLNAVLYANGNWLDGTAFFATSRSNLDTGSNTINNLQTGTLSTAYTYSTLTNDFTLAINAMSAMKDKGDKPYNPDLSDVTAIIPSQMRSIFEYTFSDKMPLIYNSATQSNQFAGQCKFVINPYQSTSDNDWYLVNNKASFKPFFVQEREGIDWTQDDDKEIRKHKFYFTVRYGVKLLNPFAIQKINN